MDINVCPPYFFGKMFTKSTEKNRVGPPQDCEGIGKELGRDWEGIEKGFGRDWEGIGKGLVRNWEGIGKGLGLGRD